LKLRQNVVRKRKVIKDEHGQSPPPEHHSVPSVVAEMKPLFYFDQREIETKLQPNKIVVGCNTPFFHESGGSTQVLNPKPALFHLNSDDMEVSSEELTSGKAAYTLAQAANQTQGEE
jgi:hypothetical protein